MLWSPTLRLISRGQRPAQTDTVSLALSACVSTGDGTLRPPHYLASWRLKYNDQMFWGRVHLEAVSIGKATFGRASDSLFIHQHLSCSRHADFHAFPLNCRKQCSCP